MPSGIKKVSGSNILESEELHMKEKKLKVRTDFPKEKYTTLMAESLPTLRMRLGLNQDELAELIGSSRQMLSLIERKIRPMMWDTFMSIMYIFRSNDETRDMLIFMGLYTDELIQFMNVSADETLTVKRIAAFGGNEASAEDEVQKRTRAALEKALQELSK